MEISIFGLGYVGCVTAACLAKAGHRVIGVDVSDGKVDEINRGRSPVVEPGLDDLVRAGVAGGRLSATTCGREAIGRSSLAMICVGTPSGPSGEIDLSALRRVCEDIGRSLRGRRGTFTVVVRSTVLPGTTERVLRPALQAALDPDGDLELRLAVNPEFMREGSAIDDFHHPPFTLVGCDRAETAVDLQTLSESVQAPFVRTAIPVAEMTKYAANAFHALKICFANEIADVCELFDVDGHEVMRVIQMDRKLNVSEAYLRPGFAFGGSCLPKDLRAILHAARVSASPEPLLSSILPSNELQVRRGIAAVLATGRKRVAVVGLAFKAGTDDLRESPMVSLIEALIGKGCHVRVLDRQVALARLVGANRRYIEQQIPHIAALMCDDIEELIRDAEVVVLGGGGEDARRALAGVRPHQVVVDLAARTVRPAAVHAEAIPVADREADTPSAVQLPLLPQPETATRVAEGGRL